jgi:hypothetical protein
MTVTTPTTQRNRSTNQGRLDLETTGPSAATGTLELAALGLDVGLLVGVGTKAEVLDGLTGVLGSTEEDGVGTSGETGGNLVDGENLTASLLDASAGRGGEAHGSDGELGELEEAVVVSDGADNDDGLALVVLRVGLVGGGSDDLGEGDGRAVDLGHHKTAEDNLVEGSVGTAGKELVQTNQQLNVGVGRLRDLAVPVSNMVAIKINSHLD